MVQWVCSKCIQYLKHEAYYEAWKNHYLSQVYSHQCICSYIRHSYKNCCNQSSTLSCYVKFMFKIFANKLYLCKSIWPFKKYIWMSLYQIRFIRTETCPFSTGCYSNKYYIYLAICLSEHQFSHLQDEFNSAAQISFKGLVNWIKWYNVHWMLIRCLLLS